MYSMGTFLEIVFRDCNHNIHNAATLLAFDNECSASWSCLMNYVGETYGDDFFKNVRIVADQDKGFNQSFDKNSPHSVRGGSVALTIWDKKKQLNSKRKLKEYL